MNMVRYSYLLESWSKRALIYFFIQWYPDVFSWSIVDSDVMWIACFLKRSSPILKWFHRVSYGGNTLFKTKFIWGNNFAVYCNFPIQITCTKQSLSLSSIFYMWFLLQDVSFKNFLDIILFIFRIFFFFYLRDKNSTPLQNLKD